MKLKTSKLLFWVFLPSLILVLFLHFRPLYHHPVLAQNDCDIGCDQDEMDDKEYLKCLQRTKECLEEKIDETQAQAQTLTGAISLINGQISLQQLQVSQTQAEIYYLESEIEELSERISGLSLSLDSLTNMLIERIQASYKQYRTSPLIAIFTTDQFTTFINQYKYLQQAEKQTASAMEEAENQRLLYDEQKTLKVVKQEQLEEKRQQLQAQQQELERSRADKQRLLTQTKNDEATYQRLLAQAQAEISSIRAYTQALFGSSYCLESPAPQPDGWFYSQRDSRWCGTRIGKSNDSIGAVGCLVTSVAMIWQKHGTNTTPAGIAANSSFFNLNTAYMILPTPPPPGFSSHTYGADLSVIDKELAEGRPVIVRLRVYFTSVGTHFVVLKSGSNGDYVMNDPLYEADLPFSSKYSTNQITSVRAFRPS